LEFLTIVENPEMDDFGWAAFMDSVDALFMGRKTLEAVLGFDCPWPYSKPVFVLSSTLTEVPEQLEGKVEIVSGDIEAVVADLNARGFERLYVDGGTLIQGLLEKDMIDEMIITRVPVLLGGGVPLFGAHAEHFEFEHVETKVHLDALVSSHYRRKR